MSKRTEYEIDLKGRESVSAVARKIVSSVMEGQQAASAAIQKVNKDLLAQGAAVAAVASKSRSAFESIASGAVSASSGIRSSAEGAARSIEKMAGQSSGLAGLNQEYARLKQLRSEAESSGDTEAAFDLEGRIRQVGFQINQAKQLQKETAAQTAANAELASSYTKAYESAKGELESGAASMAEYSRAIEDQKKHVSDLAECYRRMKADKSDDGEASRMLQQLNEEKGALAGMRDAVDKYRQSGASLRTQIASVREEMGRLRLEGRENSSEYESLRQELERMGTAYREIQVEQKALSTGATQIGGIINGVQGLMGAYSAGSGIVSLFVRDNEKLMQVQTKMQSVMAVMMGVQQMANALHSTSAFRMVTCRKVTELWTAAQNRLTVSIGMTTVASKLMMAAMTMGISLIVTGLVVAISKLISKRQEQRRKAEEARKAEEDAQKSIRSSVAGSIASQLVSYRKLQQEWKSLNGSARLQQKFIADNASEFKKLGVSVSSVHDAENVLIGNEAAFVESLKRRAMAAAAMELASKKYQSAIEKMLEAEEAKKVTDKDKKKAVSYSTDVYVGRLAAAGSNPLARGQVARQEEQIRADAIKSVIYTYGEERAKEYEDAASQEITEGDRYFGIVEKYNKKADEALNNRGIVTPKGTSGGSASLEGSIDAIEKRIQALNARMKAASASERAELRKDIDAWQDKLDAVNLGLEGLGVQSDPQTIRDLDAAISYYGKLLKVAEADERSEIQKTINAYSEKRTAIEDALSALSTPENPKTLEEYSAVLSTLERKLQTASSAEQAGIQATINAYRREEEELRARIALASAPAIPESLADYEQAISACEAALQLAGEQERASIQKTLNAYRAKKEAMEESLAAFDIKSDPQSLEEIGKLISFLEAKLQKAGAQERAELRKQIDLWGAKKSAIEESLHLVGMDGLADMVSNGLGVGNELELELRARITGADVAREKIRELQQMAAVAQTDEEKASIKGAIKQWQQFALQVGNTQTVGEKATGMLENMSSIANSMSGIVGENASGWLSWGSNVLSAVASALPAIASIIGGNIAQAFAGAAAQSQTVPFPYNLVALAASITAVTAAVASIPKFAEGGIAFGPTVGLFGEYPGAQNNPEVVAPLDRLQALIGPSDGGGTVRFRIEGRTLVGILEKESNTRRRTR